MKPIKFISSLLAAAALLATFSASAQAGSFILSGTDADDHGFASASGNVEGWLYMQKAIENLAAAPGLTNGKKTVVNLGSQAGSTAQAAASSAFSFSSLSAAGWNFVNLDGIAAITDFFTGAGATNVNNTGIVMMDSGDNVFGGSDQGERDLFTTYATVLDTYLDNGGGLFSQANDYGFLNALIPGAITVDEFSSGISLTAQGNTAFPGLSDSDLSSGPYHNSFENFGAIPVLGTSYSTGNAIIIGSSFGSITNPTDPGTSVPEPASVVGLMAFGVLGLYSARRRQAALS